MLVKWLSMTADNIEIIPGVHGKLYRLSPTTEKPVDHVNTFEQLQHSLSKKDRNIPRFLTDKWDSRSDISQSDIHLRNLQFETPLVIVDPTADVVDSLDRLDHVHQIITNNKNQKIYNKCIEYCIDVRNPHGMSTGILNTKNTIIYAADLYHKRKVIQKLWTQHDIRSYNIIDITYYNDLIDTQYGSYPSTLLAYVNYLKQVVYRESDYIAVGCLDISILPPKDQTLISDTPYIKLV